MLFLGCMNDLAVTDDFLATFPNLNEFFHLARFHVGPQYEGDVIPMRLGAPTFFGPDLTVTQYADRAAASLLYVVSRRDLHPVGGEPFSAGPIIAVHHDVPIKASLNAFVASPLSRRALYLGLLESLGASLSHEGEALSL